MDAILYRILRPIITIVFKIIYRPTIIGRENIPSKGSLVLAGNHTNNLDSILVISSNKRTIYFLAKDSLHKGFKKIIFKGMGTIPVNRKIHDKDVLIHAKKKLIDQKVVGIFPEGTINRTQDIIMPFKIGAVKMAKDTNTFLVPFTITGKYQAFKKGITIEFYEKRKIIDDNLDNENQKLMSFISEQLEKRK